MKRTLVLLTLWFAGSALPGFAVDKEVIQLQQSVALLQGMVRELQRSFDDRIAVLRTLMEQSSDRMNQVAAAMDQLQTSLQTSAGNTGQRVENLSSQMQTMEASLDELAVRLDRLAQQLAKIESGWQTISQSAAGGFGDAGTAPPPAPDVLYNTALRDYTGGNYPLSLQEFTDYLSFYQNTPLASNAQFYIGDIYYQQGQFEKAIQEYDKAIEQYPNGNKTAAAQLKKGFALINMNLRTQGIRELNSVLQRFPNTPESSLAQDKLSSLGVEPDSPGRRTAR